MIRYCLLRLVFYSLISFFFLFDSTISAQELSRDQIFQLSIDELEVLEDSLSDAGNEKYYRKVLDIDIVKCKAQRDTLELIDCYLSLVWREDAKKAYKYADSAIALTNGKIGRTEASMTRYAKGALYYFDNHPQESLKEFIEAYRYGIALRNHENILDCLNAIASLKREYSQEDEAILLQEEALKYLNENKMEISNYEESKLVTFDNISRCYLQIKEIDSTRKYTRLGMAAANDIADLESFRQLNILDAQANYYDNNLLKAKDTLLKYANYFEGTTKGDVLYYLGMIEGRLSNSIEKKGFFKQVDTILNSEEYPLMDNVKEVYQFLLKDAMKLQIDTLETKYLDRLIYYDSLLTLTEKNIRKVTLVDFDLPKEKLQIATFEKEVIQKNRLILILKIVSVFLILLIAAFYFKFRRQKQLINKFMNEEVQPIKSEIAKIEESQLNISSEIVQRMLKDLDEWELSKGFLDLEINQNILAKKLDTNSTYLSKIINVYKNQNFANYLKDLRITYAINAIKEDAEIIKNKSTIQIAEKFGFSSVDVFARSIKSKIGVTPAVFFKQINKQQFTN